MKNFIHVVAVLILTISNAHAQNKTNSQIPCLSELEIENSVHKSSVILVGEVTKLEEPPLVWSGFADSLTTQTARYKVLKTIKGNIDEKEVSVMHHIIRNSRLADSEEPRLSPTLFSGGSKFILFIKPYEDEGKYIEINSQCGAFPFNTGVMKSFAEAVDTKKTR